MVIVSVWLKTSILFANHIGFTSGVFFLSGPAHAFEVWSRLARVVSRAWRLYCGVRNPWPSTTERVRHIKCSRFLCVTSTVTGSDSHSWSTENDERATDPVASGFDCQGNAVVRTAPSHSSDCAWMSCWWMWVFESVSALCRVNHLHVSENWWLILIQLQVFQDMSEPLDNMSVVNGRQRKATRGKIQEHHKWLELW
jgi:hypothetical protein